MGSLEEQNPSLWIGTTDSYFAPPLTAGDLAVDVAVIGAGIAGMCTAFRLAREGARVAVIESGRIASGATGYTSAKITSQHNLTYARLIREYGEDKARLYGEANQAAIAAFAELIGELEISCDFRFMLAFIYTREPDLAAEIQAEAEACERLGLPACFTTSTDLPFEIQAAVRFEEQAIFHPRKFCLALARTLVEDGHHVFETTRALDIQEGEPCVVTTDRGKIHADNVVIATQIPFPGRGMFYAKTKPSRSYVLAAKLHGELPQGMYINVESPTRSIRPCPVGDETYLLLGGEGHAVGEDSDTRRRYQALEQWARATFAIDSIDYRWSAQDYVSVDGLPYIGRIDSESKHTYVATGFRKWGFTTGMVASMMIADQIGGRRNEWSVLFDAARPAVTEAPGQFISNALEVAAHFVGDKVENMNAVSADEVPAGEARIVELGGEKVAAYRDAAGQLHAVSASCTHMGCDVKWNTAEITWDCPCHGSRFDIEGAVIQGPATRDLEKKALS